MIRPIIYMTFTRAALGLTASLLWSHFARPDPSRLAWAYMALTAVFFALAWLAYLRLDGAKLPAPDKRLFEWRKRPTRSYGDISDYADDKLYNADDLEDDETDFCRLAANLISGIIFIVASLI
ncbi:MAG: hypothetical protein LBH66_07965, partial [Oscillospiraceae bacterium]|jgi:hypothetical protein|nr:hypothetical protein [Oscillospiraceae bacterium]